VDDPSKRKRPIEDIVGIDLPVQNEIDWFGQAKSLWCTLQKVDQPGSNWALGFDLPDKEEPGSEVGGVVFMGGLAHLRCTFRRPWGAHVALYPLPSCRLTSPVVGVAGDWYHSPAYENARHRHLGRLRGCDRRKRKTSRGYLNSGID
jgi:hypothetical protein